MRLRVAALCSFISACRFLDVAEPPPPPGPGTLQGRVVYATPGQSALQPAVGARITVVATSTTLVVNDEDGRFTLPDITARDGDVLLQFDANGDGQYERQRILSLRRIGAGPGRDISLGDVVLGRNARVTGLARRGDLSTVPAGHAGITVFVAAMPFTSFTGDDGSYSLDELPEGTYSVAFHRTAYAAEAVELAIAPGQQLRMRDVFLAPAPGGVEPARATGTVSVIDGTADGVRVIAASAGTEKPATTAGDGRYELDGLAPGVYSFAYEKSGWVTAVVPNVLLAPGANSLASVTLSKGTSTRATLDGGPRPYDGGATGGGAGGGSGGSAGGGSGGSAGGAAGGSAGGAAGGSAGGSAGGTAGGTPGGTAGGSSGLPVARISPDVIFGAPDASVTLNGGLSTGAQPLTYVWTQDAGPAVALSANNSAAAAAPNFRAPAAGSVLRFTLEVQDLNGTSAPAVATVRVARAPVASFTGSDGGLSVLSSGTSTLLSGASSFDRDGLLLTGFRWFQTAGPAGGFAPGDQVDTVFTAPVVTTDTLVTVALEVTNSVGIPGAPATRSFNVRPGAAFSWTVDAGATQFLNVPDTGTLVTLRGSVQSNAPGATFSHQWSQLNGTPVSLSSTTVLQPDFLAATYSGPDLTMQFRLTSTSTSGLTPPVQTAHVTVNLHETVPPTLLFNDADDGFSGMVSAQLIFSEPLQPLSGSGNNVNIIARIYGSQRLATDRLYLVHNPPLGEGSMYTLQFGGFAIRDLAGNLFALPGPVTFIARREWSPLFVTAGDSTLDPRPGLMVLADDTDPASQVQLVARRPGPVVWWTEPFDPFDEGCADDAGVCTLADLPSPPVTLSATAPPVSHHKGWRGNGLAATLVQVKDFQGTPTTLYLLPDGGTFAPAPPGPMTSDGTFFYSSYVDPAGLHLVRLDPLLNTWTSNDELVSSDTTFFASDALSFPLTVPFFDADSTLAQRWLLTRSSKTNTGQLWTRTPTGAWGMVGLNFNTNLNAIRGYRSDYRDGPAIGQHSAMVIRSTAAQSVVTQTYNLGWTGPNVAASYTPFPNAGADFAHHNGITWVAYVANDDLFLLYFFYSNGEVYTVVPGPTAAALDANPLCSPAYPELAVVRHGVVITWQERCGAGPWKLYARAVR